MMIAMTIIMTLLMMATVRVFASVLCMMMVRACAR